MVWTGVAFGGYLVVIFLAFFWYMHDRVYGDGYSIVWSTRSTSFQPIGPGYEGIHDVVLESLDAQTGELSARYSLRVPDMLEKVYVCPWFGHHEVDLGHTGGVAEAIEVALTKEAPSAGSQPKQHPRHSGQFVITRTSRPSDSPSTTSPSR